MNTFDTILLAIAGIQIAGQVAAIAVHSRKKKRMRINAAFYVPYALILFVLYRIYG